MTATPLPVTPPLAWLDTAEAAMEVPEHSVIDPVVAREGLARIARFKARIAAREMQLIRVVEASNVPKDAGATSTGSLISCDFGGDQAKASRQVRTAANLTVATLTEKALQAGEITFEKAELIAKSIAGLPETLDEVTRARVERQLINDAKRFTLTDLRRRVLRVADLYATREEANANENESLRIREARAWQNTRLWSTAPRDGLVKFGGEMPEAQWSMLQHQLGAIAAPRRRGVSRAADAASSTTGDDSADRVGPQGRIDIEELTFGQRMGRAFCHWIEKIPTDGLPTTGGTPATLTINLDYNDLQSKLAAATLATGTRISAGEARRLACSHGILPRVLNGESQIIDQGRAQRLFTVAQRLALADRDRGCTFPGCDRPPAWTEAHHLNWWAKDGGNTNLDAGALVCSHHHHHVHERDIQGRQHSGQIEWLINGIWQHNDRWRT